MEAGQVELLTALEDLLFSGKYSDLTILSNGRKYAVHRALVCSRSPFFDAACSGNFQEARDGVIDLSEDDDEAVEHMINYFYHLDYFTRDPPRNLSVSSGSSWSRPVGNPAKVDLSIIEDPLLALASGDDGRSCSAISTPHEIMNSSPTAIATHFASKLSLSSTASEQSFNSPNVRKVRTRQSSLAHDRFISSDLACGMLNDHKQQSAKINQEALSATDLVAHVRVYALAVKFGIEGLKVLAKAKFEWAVEESWEDQDLSQAMEEIYESTVENDRGLRDVVVQAFRRHPELAYRHDIQSVVKSNAPLAWDLYRIKSGIPISV